MLRQKLRAQITALSGSACRDSDAAIFRRILELPEYREAETLFAYVSVRNEVGTAEILRHAFAAGKRIALPRICAEKGKMEFALVSAPCDLTEGRFGIPAPNPQAPVLHPDSRSLILVPALCYDLRGMRLGQGGGYYDRWLVAVCAPTVGLCRDVLLQDRVPVAAHDRGVDCLITESRCRSFRGSSGTEEYHAMSFV